LEIINEVNNDDEDQNKNCAEQGQSVSDVLGNNLVDIDDDF